MRVFDAALQFLHNLEIGITIENTGTIEKLERNDIIRDYLHAYKQWLCDQQQFFQQGESIKRAVTANAALQCKERLFTQHQFISSEFQLRMQLSAKQQTEFQALTEKIRNEMCEQADLRAQGWDVVVEGPR